MDIVQAITLAFIQGFTEFLPVSSSAHLIVLPKFLDLPDQGLAFDVILHFATLCAVVLYYRSTLVMLGADFFSSVANRRMQGDSLLAWGVLLGTIPVGITGLLFNDAIETHLRSFEVVAYATIFFGIMLGLSDWVNRSLGKSREMIQGVDIFSYRVLSGIGINTRNLSLRNYNYCSSFHRSFQGLVNQICISFINSSHYSCNIIKNN